MPLWGLKPLIMNVAKIIELFLSWQSRMPAGYFNIMGHDEIGKNFQQYYDSLTCKEWYNEIEFKEGDTVEYSFYQPANTETRHSGKLENKHGHLSVHAIPLYVLFNQNHKRKVKKL